MRHTPSQAYMFMAAACLRGRTATGQYRYRRLPHNVLNARPDQAGAPFPRFAELKPLTALAVPTIHGPSSRLEPRQGLGL